MQSIKHDYINIHPVFDELEAFYTLTSARPTENPLFSRVFDVSFTQLTDLYAECANVKISAKYAKKPWVKLDLSKYDSKNIIVCFSGGKDSIAAVLHYLKLGYNVYLYHMRHINFALSDEWQIAEEFAQYMNLPLYIDEITLSGHHDWVEHPMKNMIIANGALNYGIRETIGTKIAFGNYYTSTVDDDNFSFCGGDDKETWQAYEKIIQRIIPKFRMYICLQNVGTTLKAVCRNKQLLDLSVSCIGRANLRQHKHDWVQKKYGIILPRHRCGQCYKCCIEYIYMADHDLIEYSEDYYKYCLQKLQKNSEQEGDYLYSIDDVWDRYIFYDRRKSKYAV